MRAASGDLGERGPASRASGTRGRDSRRGPQDGSTYAFAAVLSGGSSAESASTSWRTCSRGMPWMSSTALPLRLRSLTFSWVPLPLGKRLATAAEYCSASATFSGGRGLLEVGL